MNEHDTLDRLQKLTDRLSERLADAERIRARFIKAHAANAWPDLRSAFRKCGEIPELPHLQAVGNDSRRH